MIEVLLAVTAFAITLVSALGETRRKDQFGLQSLTRTGWVALSLALIILLFSTIKAISSARDQADIEFDRIGAQRAAHTELAEALFQLESAMPRFKIVPYLFSENPGKEEIDKSKLGWIQTEKASDYSRNALAAAERLRIGLSMFSQYISGKNLSKAYALLNHNALEVVKPHPTIANPTLEQKQFDETTWLHFQTSAVSLACEFQTDARIFKHEIVDISNELFESQIKESLASGEKSMSREVYMKTFSIDKALSTNRQVVGICREEDCHGHLKNLSDKEFCARTYIENFG